MTLDRAFLAAHASHEEGGVEERAFHLEVSGERMFAILSQPQHDPMSDLGFVVAHSFGLEVLTLRRSERAVARALAGAGHPVLYFHRRGFGDSDGDVVEATLERQLEDLRAGARWLRRHVGVVRIGVIGARFGGLLAGLFCREGAADRLALFQPSLSGSSYAKGFLRELQVVRMADPDGEEPRGLQDLVEDMRRDGVVDVLGYGLASHLYEALQDVDLSREAPATDTLLVQVAKRSGLSREYQAFAGAIEAAGGRCRTEQVREPAGTSFGSATFVATTQDVNVRIDVMRPVADELARLTMEWA